MTNARQLLQVWVRAVVLATAQIETAPSSVDKLIDSLDVNLLFAFASLGDIVRSLHPHERVHLHAKGFFDAERHISRKIGFAVEQAR